MGYYRAGFEVVGVDLNPQPNYPFEFHQADALTYPIEGFDVVHASPPCQAYSSLRTLGKQSHMPRFHHVEPIRARLRAAEVPYVIENVEGAPLLNPVRLCGQFFGLGVRRHRLFESNVFLMAASCEGYHTQSIGVYGDHPQISRGMNRAHTLEVAKKAMGIDWMTWHELCEAIPPVYTEFIGEQLMRALEIAA